MNAVSAGPLEGGLALGPGTPGSAYEVPLSPLCSTFVTLACSPLGTRASMVPGTQETLDKYLPKKKMSDSTSICLAWPPVPPSKAMQLKQLASAQV